MNFNKYNTQNNIYTYMIFCFHTSNLKYKNKDNNICILSSNNVAGDEFSDVTTRRLLYQ